MYRRLYLSWYKSRLYSSRYKRDESDDNKVLITVWLEVKNDLILGLRDRNVTMALQLLSLLDVSLVKRIIILITWWKTF